MGLLGLFASLFLVSINTFAVEKIAKTYDGHRALCRNAHDIRDHSRKKAINLTQLGNGQVKIELLKCKETGWAQDVNPNIERVDEPAITPIALYKHFTRYSLLVMNNGGVTDQLILDGVLRTGREIVDASQWASGSEILISVVVELRDAQGRIVDEKHEEFFGSFNVLL